MLTSWKACVWASCLLIWPLTACQTKAKKQAELAEKDLVSVEQTIQERYANSLERALAPVASAMASAALSASAKASESSGPLPWKQVFEPLRDKNEDLRRAKRSYFAVVDHQGEIRYVDESAWTVTGRKMDIAFPAVKEVLDGATSVSKGAGRYGGASENALTYVRATAFSLGGQKERYALVAAWEAHDAAEDLQRQLQTTLNTQAAPARRHVKQKEKRDLIVNAPDVWVAIFRGAQVYLPDHAPPPLEEAVRAIKLHEKTANGLWKGTFDVSNRTWGVAAKRTSALDAESGVAVLRYAP